MIFLPVDYFFCFLILVFGLVALGRGFLSEVFGKAAWVAGIICAVLFYKKLAHSLEPKISSQILCVILAFLMIFIVVFLIVKITEMILQKICTFSLLNSLNHGLGLLFGLAEGFAVVCLIIFVLQVQPFVNTGTLLNGSFFANLMGIVFSSDVFKSKGGRA